MKGIATLAIEGFWENLKRKIETQGSYTFELKAKGKIKNTDVSTWAEKEGYRQEWNGPICTLKKVKKLPPNFWKDLKTKVANAGAASVSFDPDSSITRLDLWKFANKNNFLHQWTEDGMTCHFARKQKKAA